MTFLIQILAKSNFLSLVVPSSNTKKNLIRYPGYEICSFDEWSYFFDVEIEDNGFLKGTNKVKNCYSCEKWQYVLIRS